MQKRKRFGDTEVWKGPGAQKKPIEGNPEPPMLRNGNADAKFEFSFWNLMLLSRLLWTAVCEIVGNADEANTPSVIALAVVGNEIAEASLSVASAVSFWNTVNV